MNMDTPTPAFQGCVLPDGLTFDAKPDQTLFQSLHAAGIYWPVSCRTGTCRTCRAQLLQGQIRYGIEWPGLSVEEKQEGWILPCVAYPVTDVVLKDPLAD